MTKLRAVLNELKTAMTADFESMLSEASGHHHFDGKDYYADTAFLNSLSGVLPGMEMKHLGFGEFSYQGDEGEVEFDRMRGKDFPGMSGRSHKLYDNKNGKLVAKLIKAMETNNKSELVKESFDGDGANLTEALNGKVSTFLTILSSHLTQYDQKQIASETKRGGQGNIYRLGHLLGAASNVRNDVKDVEDSDSPEALAKLKKSLGKRFNVSALPPTAKLLKQIDAFVDSGKLPKITVQKAKKIPSDLSDRHGGPKDRGSADAYYGRPKDPHKYADGTNTSERIALTDRAEIAAYNDAYDGEGDRKDWG